MEHLYAITRTVAYVDKSIVRNFSTVDWAPELLGWWILRSVKRDWSIIGSVPISSPVSLEFARSSVEYCDSPVAIAVGDVGLIGDRVD